jgi:hypothetical protein
MSTVLHFPFPISSYNFGKYARSANGSRTWQASICFDPLHDFPTLISLSVSSGTDSFRVEGSAAAYKSKYTPFIQELRTTVLLMDKYTV